MKQLFAICILVAVYSTARSQDTTRKEAYVGLDVINSLPSYIFPNKYYIRNTIIIEPYYLFDLPRANRRLYLGTVLPAVPPANSKIMILLSTLRALTFARHMKSKRRVTR